MLLTITKIKLVSFRERERGVGKLEIRKRKLAKIERKKRRTWKGLQKA